MRALRALVFANLRSFLRDRLALFWTLAFPILFVFLFGSIFSNSGSSTTFDTGWVDQDGTPAAAGLRQGFVSTGLAFLIAVAYGDATTVLIMGIYTIVFNIVQGNIVTPLVYRRAVHLHPAVILLAIPAGGALGGIAGMFLAVPVLAIIETARRPIMRVLDDLPDADPGEEVQAPIDMPAAPEAAPG